MGQPAAVASAAIEEAVCALRALVLAGHVPASEMLEMLLQWHEEVALRRHAGRPWNLRFRHHGDTQGHRGLHIEAGGEERIVPRRRVV